MRCGAARSEGAPAPAAAVSASLSGWDFAFTGSALSLFGRALALVLAMFLVVPAPWATCWFYTWFIGKVRGRYGSRLSFHGTPGSVWVLTTLHGFVILSGIGWDIWTASAEDLNEWAEAGFLIVNDLASFAVGFFLFRWVIGSIALDGQRLRLSASFAKYLGWTILLALSVVTIIG